MFDRILQTAHETGAEVLVQLKDSCCDQYRGRVLGLEPDYFALFHSGPGGGVHWAFKRSDIAFIGLIVELPNPEQVSSSSVETSAESLRVEQREDKNK